MKGNVHIRSEMYLTKARVVGQSKYSRNYKHFTLCGLTLLSGDPLVYLVILAGTREN